MWLLFINQIALFQHDVGILSGLRSTEWDIPNQYLSLYFKKRFKSFNVCVCKLRQKGFHSFGPWLLFFLFEELIFSSQRQLSNGRRRSMLLMLPIISIAHLNLFLSFLFTLSLSLSWSFFFIVSDSFYPLSVSISFRCLSFHEYLWTSLLLFLKAKFRFYCFM